MKIIRNNICYIESEDIEFVNQRFVSKIPVVYSLEFNFEKYETKEMVTYFKENETILDYDLVQNLSGEELDVKISELSQRIEKLEKSVQNNLDLASLTYILQSLRKYSEKRDLYDREIRNLSFTPKCERVPLQYMSAVPHTPPVATIPVSGEALYGVDQSIIDKCIKDGVETVNDTSIYCSKVKGKNLHDKGRV